ncbi:MAG: hypothetical protein MHM6MM_002566 [Cercozoa sp. M6MM]
MEGAILGCGNPLLDISSTVEQEMLDKYEVTLGNAILAEDKHMPVYEELANLPTCEYIAGGSTMNSIRVAQWVLQQPGAAHYSGCIGQDKFGAQLEQCVSDAGVTAHFQIDEKRPTGTCAVLVKQHERSLIANLAAANHFEQSHLETPAMKEAVARAKIIYCAGFFLTVSPPSIMQMAEHALANGQLFAMNLSAPFICQYFKEPLLQALEYVDILFANETESHAFGEALGLEDLSTEAVARHVAAMPKKGDRPRTVVFTQGAEPVIVVTQNGQHIEVFDVPALAEDKIVDVNGAGDAFVGGFVAMQVQGKPMNQCVRAGIAASRYMIQRAGTSTSGVLDFDAAAAAPADEVKDL